MANGENYEYDDKRLTYIYNELVKCSKLKHDVWTCMLKTPEFNVCIYLKIFIYIVCTLICTWEHCTFFLCFEILNHGFTKLYA